MNTCAAHKCYILLLLGVSLFSQTCLGKLLFLGVNPESASQELQMAKRIYGEENVVAYKSYQELISDLKNPEKAKNFHHVKSWVISGHSTGSAFQTLSLDPDGQVSRGMQDISKLQESIALAQKRDPRILSQVKHVYGFGCYTGTCNALRRWEDFHTTFRELKSIGGFEKKGPSPMGETLFRAIHSYETSSDPKALAHAIDKSRTTYHQLDLTGPRKGTLIGPSKVSQDHSIDRLSVSDSEALIKRADDWLNQYGSGGSSFNAKEYSGDFLDRMSFDHRRPFPDQKEARKFYEDVIQQLPNLHPSLYGSPKEGGSKPASQLLGSYEEPSSQDFELRKERWLRLIYADNIASSFLEAGKDSGLFASLKEATDDNDAKRFFQDLLGNSLTMSPRDQVKLFQHHLKSLPDSYGRLGLSNFARHFSNPWDLENGLSEKAFPLQYIDQKISRDSSGASKRIYENLKNNLSQYKPLPGGRIPESESIAIGWEPEDTFGAISAHSSPISAPARIRNGNSSLH